MRGATSREIPARKGPRDFNPRAPCGARLGEGRGGLGQADFNPRAPCGARHTAMVLPGVACAFQSTRPMRGATCWPGGCTPGCCHFNPRAPCGARPHLTTQSLIYIRISIHAPHAGRDGSASSGRVACVGFQSTRPMRGATKEGETFICPKIFQSTRPMRGATAKVYKLLYTLLRQKTIFRQFLVKRRLLKRFSTYKYRKTFLICSANRMEKTCTLPLRTTRSSDLPEGMSACSQSARFCFHTLFPSSKTAGYPSPDP